MKLSDEMKMKLIVSLYMLPFVCLMLGLAYWGLSYAAKHMYDEVSVSPGGSITYEYHSRMPDEIESPSFLTVDVTNNVEIKLREINGQADWYLLTTFQIAAAPNAPRGKYDVLMRYKNTMSNTKLIVNIQ